MNLPSVASLQARAAALGIAGVVVAILAIGYAMKSCQGSDNTPKIPPKVQKTIDSLDNTKKSFEQTQDSIRHVVVYDTVKATVYAAAATRAKAAAENAQRRADSLAIAAGTAVDSATAWHKAYDARTAEAVGLRVEAAKSDSAYRSERDARLNLSTLYGADTLRRVALDNLNRDLRKTIDDLERPCKVLKYISCPSRTTTGVISALAGAGAVYITKKP